VTFTQIQLRERLLALSIPAWTWQLADAGFETVDRSLPLEVWHAWIQSLRDNAPECLATIEIGGGKSRTVPRWIEEAADCENHSLMCFAHFLTGSWIFAARGGPRRGRCFGLVFYTAQPRAENRHRAGGHAALWCIDHAGEFRFFEPGDGEETALLEVERSSAFFGLAA